ncbi:hypothetical protein [Effusibacillus dendaii]|uniref:hypothetical protein n=1 Tax=Effusibacillus dendaii TaxID=2743772 RepID=UPI00190C8708|nr:hypothetical protein [Effusibacillus dendaii]
MDRLKSTPAAATRKSNRISTADRRKSPNSTTRKKSVGRKSAISRQNAANSGSSKASGLLSLSNLGNLSAMCKQCLKYLQQADVWLETINKASTSLNEAGLLQKLIKTKGKGLSTGDMASVLMAFMNTPLADQFFKGGSSEEDSSTANRQPANQSGHPEQNPSSPPASSAPSAGHPGWPRYPGMPPGPPTFGQPAPPAWPGYMQGYNPPPPTFPQPHSYPAYGYPPAQQLPANPPDS